MQLQGAKQRFEAQGLKLAAISYDSPAILKDFAKRHRIDFPLLADPRSEIIRSFNVLNTEAKGMTKGMAYPGFFYIDESGVIREKYFEAKYTNRFTANNVIGKLFPELTEEVTQNIEAPHLRLALAQSDRTVAPGSRVTLVAEIELPPGVHVLQRATSRFSWNCSCSRGSNSQQRLTRTPKSSIWRRFRNAYRSSRASSASPRMLL